MDKTAAVLLIILVVGLQHCGSEYSPLEHETVKMMISQSALDYISSELKRLIPTLEAELQDFSLPTDHNLKLSSLNIGSLSMKLQDDGLRLRIDNNQFVLDGDLCIKIVKGVPSIKSPVTITASNFGIDTVLKFNNNEVKSVSLKSCNVDIGPLVVSSPMGTSGHIKKKVEERLSSLCDDIRDKGIPAINTALAALPKDYPIGDVARVVFTPGDASFNAERFIASFYASVQPPSGDADWKFPERRLPNEAHTEQRQWCLWVSEYLLNSALGILVPSGRGKVLDAALMAGLAVDIKNSAAPVLSLNKDDVYLQVPLNVAINGADDNTLGEYSTHVHLTSAADFIYQQLIRAEKEEEMFYDGKSEWSQDDYQSCDMSAECDEEDDSVGSTVELGGAVEYLLNKLLPSKDYIQFYDVKSDILNGASRTCGNFLSTDRTREMLREQIKKVIRSLPGSAARCSTGSPGSAGGQRGRAAH